MEETESAEELLAKQHRKEKKDLQGGTPYSSTFSLFLIFITLLSHFSHLRNEFVDLNMAPLFLNGLAAN